MQARRGKFVSAGNREPLFWLKHDPVRLLDADVNLKAARVPAEARVELAVAFTSIDLLPDSTANRVPDPNKGTPLQPPGAFTARFLLLTCSPCMSAPTCHVNAPHAISKTTRLACSDCLTVSKKVVSEVADPALQKKKDLTVAEAHLVLLEYLEERPLLLARPGNTCAGLTHGHLHSDRALGLSSN